MSLFEIGIGDLGIIRRRGSRPGAAVAGATGTAGSAGLTGAAGVAVAAGASAVSRSSSPAAQP